MKVGEWLQRYASQIKILAPETTDTGAVMLAISGLGCLFEAQVITEMTPEDHADLDVATFRRTN